ncbi:MAG: glycine zipper 2TM domain-containing protein [Burkholderiales bacterium]|nr:glycine zipper 2TM domain-containing protein [Burkholderiales bacterium]MDE1928329.1 glycine zipper 2TM domain-containing protein [Burkholderiales bacterium]MDE2157710.1 glycine zipper 2TM domain-containing protein [Burkholderiales bacterium]MDE2504970.1 glycine zipper 2TM domain-containing protein [Burkholderiales bacterium]
MAKGLVIGGVAAVVLGAGAVTGYRAIATPKSAEVVAVKEVIASIVTPRQHCDEVAVRHQAAVQDRKRWAGSLIGGLAGGLLGNRIGGGNGKTLATVAGAVAGGYAGNQVQKGMQERDAVVTNERRCRNVNESSQRVVGYDVTYRLAGKEGVVRTALRPGPTLPVQDGQVVVVAPPAPAPS